MEKVAALSPKERNELFSLTSLNLEMTEAIVEKDFWVTWTLNRIFQSEDLQNLLIFKGGTSLSKVYGVVDRFSEDIDLILDWRILTEKNPTDSRSKTKQQKINLEINESAKAYIGNQLLKNIREITTPYCDCEVDTSDGHVINIEYPTNKTDDYLRPKIRLEIGPLASWNPHSSHSIQSYAAQEYPAAFVQPSCRINVIAAERTFWEKITILHHEAHRPEHSPQPKRYSRHYYDVVMLDKTDIKKSALGMKALLADVVEFKTKFYPRGWARYDLAVPGSLKIMPPDHILNALEQDYAEMRSMIYGEYPQFLEILETLNRLEVEINAL